MRQYIRGQKKLIIEKMMEVRLLIDIKAIALDMDGTLLNDKNTVSDELVKLFCELCNQNIRIFIATGRTKQEIYKVLPEKLPIDGFVSANGMSCFTNHKDISQHTLPADLVKTVLTNARKRNLYYEIHPKNGSRFALKEDKETLEKELHLPRPDTLLNNKYIARVESVQNEMKWIDEISYEDNLKIYFFSMNTEIINNWKHTLKEIRQKTDFSLFSSSLHNAEIMVSNVSKATGIEMLLKEYNLSKENLMAIGDGENDLPMFELAAYSIAMKNAEDTIQE